MNRKYDYAVEELRHAARYFDHWNESWNMLWTMEELLLIFRFAMSTEGGKIDEDPTTWDREILLRAGIKPAKLSALGYRRVKAAQ